MNNVPRNTLNATETSCATVQRNTIYELLRTKLSDKYAKQTQFPKSQMNVKSYNTKDYENKYDWTLGENKPNSNPIKPNFRRARMNINSLITKDYRKKDDFAVRKNKPNSNPISNAHKPIKGTGRKKEKRVSGTFSVSQLPERI